MQANLRNMKSLKQPNLSVGIRKRRTKPEVR